MLYEVYIVGESGTSYGWMTYLKYRMRLESGYFKEPLVMIQVNLRLMDEAGRINYKDMTLETAWRNYPECMSEYILASMEQIRNAFREVEVVSKRPKFPLGVVVATRGVRHEVDINDIEEALGRHVTGDWGNVPPADRRSNNIAVKEGYRIISSYTGKNGVKFWIITEADRSATTVLLPEEY